MTVFRLLRRRLVSLVSVGYLLWAHWPIIGTSLTLDSRAANTCPLLSWPDRGHYQRSQPQWGPQGLHYSLAQQAFSQDRSGQHKPTPSCPNLFRFPCPASFTFCLIILFSGTPSYFLSFRGCFPSIDLQPHRLSLLSFLELCLWPPKLQLIWRNHNIACVLISVGSMRLINL